MRAGSGVERVAVEHEMVDTVEQRPQLRQFFHTAHPVAEMDVGENTEERRGHEGASERPRVRGATRKALRAIGAVGALALSAAALPAAEALTELTALHLAAMGGAERVAALGALRATGEVEAGGKRMRFMLLAARPDRVRLETEASGRRLVQGTDGTAPPWEVDLRASAGRSVVIPPAAARVFAADAEFDGPIVSGAARGFVIEEAGQVEVDGVRLRRLLVTRRMTDSFWLLLDPRTFLVVRRIEHRVTAIGRRAEVVTRYGDFRPVDGVLHPHHIEVAVDGRTVQLTRIERIESNPAIEPGVFQRPEVAEKK
jgi:hypothetical protein